MSVEIKQFVYLNSCKVSQKTHNLALKENVFLLTERVETSDKKPNP